MFIFSATVFLRLDLCYNTVHEFDPEFSCEVARLHDCGRCGKDSGWRACESDQRCFVDLSQLLNRVARIPLQGGLPEMRLLFELL
jgi:hypothetical protein